MLKKFFSSILLFSALNVMLYEVCAENVIILDSVDGAESEYKGEEHMTSGEQFGIKVLSELTGW